MSLDSAFWVWNLVANYAYDRGYATVFPVIQTKLGELESAYAAKLAQTDVQVGHVVDMEVGFLHRSSLFHRWKSCFIGSSACRHHRGRKFVV